jgi:hypothetical protein
MKFLLMLSLALFAQNQSPHNAITLGPFDFSGTNVTSAAYVELDDGTLITKSINCFTIFMSNENSILLAKGLAGSEVDMITIPPGGVGETCLYIPQGVRVSMKATSTTLSTGELILNGFPK